MGVLQRIGDGLVNVIANLGTARDKAAHSEYTDTLLQPTQLLAAYSNSWLAAAIVDYPAEDATRKWRQWRAPKDQITKIEALEKALGVQRKTQDALVAARLYGGSAIYINTGDSQQEAPLTTGAEIQSLVVLTSNSLNADEIVRDINSPYYGRPEYYTLTSGSNSSQVRIHASRLVVFRGATVPDDPIVGAIANRRWGNSVLQATYDAIQQTDSTMANMASLVFEAKVDVLKFEGFAEMLADEKNDPMVTRRLQGQAAMKGINGAVVIDSKDDYQQKSANFSGLPDVVHKFMEAVSGASRIPITRLYGRSVAGLSGSGDGDERVYFDRIGHLQAIDIQPEMALLDECLIWQALGSRPADIFYEWRPLRQLTETERAEIFSKTASAARSIAGTSAGALIPMDALSDSLVNELTEQGVLPGLDQAIEKYGSLAAQDLPPEGDDTDPATAPREAEEVTE